MVWHAVYQTKFYKVPKGRKQVPRNIDNPLRPPGIQLLIKGAEGRMPRMRPAPSNGASLYLAHVVSKARKVHCVRMRAFFCAHTCCRVQPSPRLWPARKVKREERLGAIACVMFYAPTHGIRCDFEFSIGAG